MKRFIYIYKTLFISLLMLSCSGGGSDDGGGGGGTPQSTTPPEAAVLVYPLKDEVCTTGTFTSDTESELEFEWNAAKDSDSYEIILKDLNTNQEITIASTTVKKVITLKQNTPYSWKIVSLSKKTEETATSEEWRFYNASQGVENYAPFPAELITPQDSSILSTSSVDLVWEGQDVDGASDIESYEVFLDQQNPPVTSRGTVSTNGTTVSSLANGTYYWIVETTDKSGNKTKSQVSSFTLE